MNSNKRIWIGIGLLVCIVCALVIFSALIAPSLFRNERKMTLNEIEQVTRISFPPETKLLDSCFVGWQGWEIRAKLVLNKSSINSFVDSLPMPHKTSQTDKFGISNSMSDYCRVGWWDPDSAASIMAVSAEYHSEGNLITEMRMLIVESNARQNIVYLYCVGS